MDNANRESIEWELMDTQLESANACLDTADSISNPGVKAWCIERATQSQNTVADWLRTGKYPRTEVRELEDGLRKVVERIALHSSESTNV